MEKDQYIIVSKTAIQKRIEELENYPVYDSKEGSMIDDEIRNLKKILFQSTPLIPVLEDAFNIGANSQFEVQEKNLTNKEEIRDYHQKKLINISNLKLNI